MWHLIGIAVAVPLYAPPAAVDALEHAREALWPGGDLQIVADAPRYEGRALVYDGQRLVLFDAGVAFVEASEVDASAVVLLARSWLSGPPVPVEPIVGRPEPEPVPGGEERLVPVPEPVQGPPRTWTLGVGLRAAVGDGAEGPRVAVGVQREALELEVALFLSADRPSRVSPLDRVVLGLAGAPVRSLVDAGSIGVWGCARPPAPVARGLQAGARACVGLEVVESRVRSLTPGVSGPVVRVLQASRLDPGIGLGAGADLWWGALGVRWTVRGVFRALSVVGGPVRFGVQPTLTVDLSRRQRP